MSLYGQQYNLQDTVHALLYCSYHTLWCCKYLMVHQQMFC